MADSDERPALSRRNTAGAASRRSGGSRPSSPPLLSRLVSGNHLDDHSQYQGHHYHQEVHEEALHDEDSSDETTETDLSEKGSNTDEGKESNEDEIVPDVRDGIEDQRDLEAGPNLEKSKSGKSGRSARDPTLVTWDGPDDPLNPKNWTFKHKWAATLVGKCPSHANIQRLIDQSLVVYFHLSGFFIYGRASTERNCPGISHHQRD